MRNSELMAIVNCALIKNKREGIVLKDSYQMIKVLDENQSDICSMIEVIKDTEFSYKIIPKAEYDIQYLGQDSDDTEYWSDDYYIVFGVKEQLGIVVVFQGDCCCGAKAIKVDKIPNYLLAKFGKHILNAQAKTN